MKDTPPRQLFLIICGLLFIVVGVLVSEPVVASFTEDGEINSGVIRAALWGLAIGFILVGAAIILLRRSTIVFRLVMMLVVALLTFAVVDYSLYLAVSLMPAAVVRIMSPQAQLRYFKASQGADPWIYEENFRHGRPGAELDGVTADEYGYRNPPGYMANVDTLDILLIGDSFTWGTADQTIADYMRTGWPGLTVYSTGIFGNGIPQWPYHFEDYLNRIGSAPHTVVFNFYAGNDLSDTEFYRRVRNFVDKDKAITYYMYYNNPYLVPAEPDGITWPKMPETAFLVMGMLAGSEQTSAEPPRLQTNYTVDEPWPIFNEPPGQAFTRAVLEELDTTVERIHQLAPDTQIVLSYIPTIAAVYGSLLVDCPWCAADIEQEAQNAALMTAHSEMLGIHFVDVTPALQAAALEKPIWATDGHFSEEGYAVYAEALGEALLDD